MQLNRFDLNLLIALDALLHEKNVTRAAERVFVSQPAMSAALQKLRDYFNDQLLVRVGRDMELDPARPVARRSRCAKHSCASRSRSAPSRRSIRPRYAEASPIICSADAHLRVMPGALRRAIREAPGVQCHIEQFSETTLSRLEYGDADLYLGMNILPVFGEKQFPDWLRVVDIRPVQWACVCCGGSSERAAISSPKSSTARCRISSAGPTATTCRSRNTSGACWASEINVRATVQSLVEILFLLQGTDLIATLPERLVTALSNTVPLKIFPLPVRVAETREVLVWHKRNEPDPGHAWMRELLLEVAREP